MYSRYLIHSILYIFILVVYLPLRAQQELKICALRVEFQPDNNPLTTGNGQFMSDASEVTPFTIDPPPHGRSYFKDQIIAVDNYYFAASKGKLNISGIVFPLDNESVYVVPREMGYYNPNTNEDENNFRLAQLFSDAITIADSDPDIVFSNFDLVTIFHAGVGKDIDLGFDDTPQDIPSIYYTPDFLKRALGNDFNGIIVDQGDAVIERAALLPETESQADFEIALTGIFAANVGSHLGMYDLFSPTTQTSGIGSFGVMDAGLFNVFGLLPAMPCAFSRMLMGWDTPVLLTQPIDNIEIARYEGANSSAVTMYQIPINSQEYYLLEYRGERQYNIDSAFVVISEGRDVLPTYLEVLKTYLPDRIHVSDSTGVLLHVDSYDWGLPGSGILIWHIDESIISQQGRSNAINEDRENRAVDLEEADGSQDIGYTYSIVEPGYQSELGTWLDFWFSQNLAPLYNNEFSVLSSPNTRSNRNYANSHIILNNFSNNNKSTMTFSYNRSFYNAGFPITINTEQEISYYSNPKLTTVPIAVASTMFISDDKGRIFAVSGDGKGVLYQNKLQIAQFSAPELPQFAFMDISNDNETDLLIAAGQSGYINTFIFEDSDQDSLLDTLYTFKLTEKITTPPIVQSPYFYVGTAQGNIFRFALEKEIDSVYTYSQSITNFTVMSPQGVELIFNQENMPDFPPVIIDLNSDDQYEKVVFTSFNKIQIESAEDKKIIELPDSVVAQAAFADVGNDGYYEIIFNLPAQVYGINFNGSLISNMPFAPVLLQDERLIGTPLIFDADGDGSSDIVCITSFGQIFAFNQEGNVLRGFPFTLGNIVSLTPVAGNTNINEQIELLALNDMGDIFSWKLDARQETNTLWWYQSSFDYTNNHFISKRLDPIPNIVSDLIPSARAYNYPNPNTENFTKIRYFLRENAQVDIKIFDLAGDLVDSFTGPGVGNRDNEIRWNLVNVASGVYLCRIEASSAGTKEVQTIKIMVVN